MNFTVMIVGNRYSFIRNFIQQIQNVVLCLMSTFLICFLKNIINIENLLGLLVKDCSGGRGNYWSKQGLQWRQKQLLEQTAFWSPGFFLVIESSMYPSATLEDFQPPRRFNVSKSPPPSTSMEADFRRRACRCRSGLLKTIVQGFQGLSIQQPCMVRLQLNRHQHFEPHIFLVYNQQKPDAFHRRWTQRHVFTN